MTNSFLRKFQDRLAGCDQAPERPEKQRLASSRLSVDGNSTCERAPDLDFTDQSPGIYQWKYAIWSVFYYTLSMGSLAITLSDVFPRLENDLHQISLEQLLKLSGGCMSDCLRRTLGWIVQMSIRIERLLRELSSSYPGYDRRRRWQHTKNITSTSQPSRRPTTKV